MLRFSSCIAIALVVSFASGCGARSELRIPHAACEGGVCPSAARLILFGGNALDGSPLVSLDDTWAWDGTRWTQLHPTESPPARANASMATLGQRIVMTGGVPASMHAFGDTWTWAGDWVEVTTAHAPSPRQWAPVGVLDGTLVLFSGLPDGNQTNDTWTFDGADWTQAHPMTSPSKRNRAAMATLGRTVILYGGWGDAGFLDPNDIGDTWQWSATGWTRLTPATSPRARDGAVAVTLGSTVVLFGGGNSLGAQNDTWSFDGTTWRQIETAHSPPSRFQFCAGVLDGQMVVFGGFHPDHAVPADTWTFDGRDWTQHVVSGPSRRAGCAMATEGT